MATTINSYKAGNTIRLTCQFRDFGNNPVDPSLIQVKIYDQRYNVVMTQSISTANRQDIGLYFYDYTIPMSYQNQKLYYEFYGELSGNPSLNRDVFKVVFM